MQKPRSFCKESMTVPWSAVLLQVSSCPTVIRCIHKDAQGSATTIRVPSVHEMKHTTCPNIELISRACRVSVTSFMARRRSICGHSRVTKIAHGHASNMHESHASCKGTAHLPIHTPGQICVRGATAAKELLRLQCFTIVGGVVWLRLFRGGVC